MKRTSKLLLMTGLVAASLAGPATSAQANECIGVEHQNGQTQAGSWNCGDTCPPPTYGPLDGHFHVIICTDPA